MYASMTLLPAPVQPAAAKLLQGSRVGLANDHSCNLPFEVDHLLGQNTTINHTTKASAMASRQGSAVASGKKPRKRRANVYDAVAGKSRITLPCKTDSDWKHRQCHASWFDWACHWSKGGQETSTTGRSPLQA